jgi:hypothetical protein
MHGVALERLCRYSRGGSFRPCLWNRRLGGGKGTCPPWPPPRQPFCHLDARRSPLGRLQARRPTRPFPTTKRDTDGATQLVANGMVNRLKPKTGAEFQILEVQEACEQTGRFRSDWLEQAVWSVRVIVRLESRFLVCSAWTPGGHLGGTSYSRTASNV